jgi:hypothetical protein
MAIIEKFELAVKPEGKAVFRNLPGWKFDEGVWNARSLENKDFRLPLRSDIDLTSIPEAYYKSGVTEQQDLEFEEINFEDQRLQEGWTPAVKRGKYFSHATSANLHGTQSIIELCKDELSGGRSTLDLDQRPSPFLPITVEYLQRDVNTLAVESSGLFSKVVKFKGVASLNGREMDGDVFANTDTTVNQFKIEAYDSEPKLNVDIAVGTNFTEIEPVQDIWAITILDSPVRWWKVTFSRPDIFRTELSFETFLARLGAATLVEGDYAVGYKGHWTEGMGVRAYLPVAYADYGTISYKPTCDANVTFNKDVRVTQTVNFPNTANATVFYLPSFPVLDLSSYQDGDLAGPLVLDPSSTIVTVDPGGAATVWDRVADLTASLPADTHYELDPLYGTITFGDGVKGATPAADIQVDWTQVPLIQYDTVDARELFDDPREDLDPLVNSLKQGFLVLDNRRVVASKIELCANGPITTRTDGSTCYGPLNVPVADESDLLVVRARVTANGVPRVGVPNVPVEFRSLDGLIIFSQNFSVTDGEGYAYTEAQGVSTINEFIASEWLYDPMDPAVPDYLNPDPAAGDLVALPTPIVGGAPDTILVKERFDGNIADVYMLIQSIPSLGADFEIYANGPVLAEDWPEPYDSRTRRGGLTAVWHRTVAGAEEVVHPIAFAAGANPAWTEFQFPDPIPTGQLIVAYKLVIERSAQIVAYTIEDPILVSNQVEICLQLNDSMKGQWKLPNLPSPDEVEFLENPAAVLNDDGSRLTSAVYMSPNDLTVTDMRTSAAPGVPIAAVTVGTDVIINGLSFPTTAELEMSVYIIKVDTDDKITAVKDITADVTYIDATTIRIQSFPTPPTLVYGIPYWVAVAGFHPDDGAGVRKTATLITINV